MPRKQNLYIFLGQNDSDDYEISTKIVLKYLNRFVIEESAQVDVIQIHQLQKCENQENRVHPRNLKEFFVQVVNDATSAWFEFCKVVIQAVVKRGSETTLPKQIQEPILEAIIIAGILDDNDTDAHLIFGNIHIPRFTDLTYNDLLGHLIELTSSSYYMDLFLSFTLQLSTFQTADFLGTLIKRILSASVMSPNAIRVTWLDGCRLRVTGKPRAPTKINDWSSFMLGKILNMIPNIEDVDSLNTSILGDDLERFFNDLKLGKDLEVGNGFYSHQMLNNDIAQKVKSGDKVFLANLAETLLDKQIPLFSRDDQLFFEIFCARRTFTVKK